MKDEKVAIIKRRSIRFLSEHHSSKAPNLITENHPLSPNLPVDDLVQTTNIYIGGDCQGRGRYYCEPLFYG